MFDTVKGEEIKGGGSRPTLYTGLAPLELHTINPTNKEYAEITGVDIPYDLEYDKVELNGEFARPMNLLFKIKNTDSFILSKLYLIDKVISNKNGDKFKFIDFKGNITYYCTEYDVCAKNPKMGFREWAAEPHHKLKVGEDTLVTLLMSLSNYAAKGDSANFISAIAEKGVTFENAYDNDIKALREGIANLRALDKTVVMPLIVSEKTKGDKTYYRQEVLMNPDYMWSASYKGDVSEWMINQFRKAHDKQTKDGYSITKKYFTFEFAEFEKSKCVGHTEAAPTNSLEPSGAPKISDDLPF